MGIIINFVIISLCKAIMYVTYLELSRLLEVVHHRLRRPINMELGHLVLTKNLESSFMLMSQI